MNNNQEKQKRKQSRILYFAKLGLWLIAVYILFFTTLIEDTSRALDNFGGEEPAQVEEPIDMTPVQATPVVPSVPKKKAPKPCEKIIKGNISSSGDKVYHVPGGDFYDTTVAEEMFCTPAEAAVAGYRKSKR